MATLVRSRLDYLGDSFRLGCISGFGNCSIADGSYCLARAFPKALPFWGPFDASITVRDIRVAKAQDAKRANPAIASDAADIQIEFVETKTGPSALQACVPELKLSDVFRPLPEPARAPSRRKAEEQWGIVKWQT